MEKCTCQIGERGVALITLSNPPMNAFDEEMLLALEETVRRIGVDSACKVAVITGEGPVFIVGADVTEFTGMFAAGEEAVAKGVLEVNKMLCRFEDLPFPTVAAINGICLGGGLELALACDYRVASTAASMGFPEVKLVPGKDIVAPYDVTAWSLPLSMGVTVEKGTLPPGLGPLGATGPVPSPLEGAGAFALGPESPERWKVVAAARKGGEVSFLPKAAGALPAGTVLLDAGAAKAAARVAADLGLPLSPLAALPAGATKLRAPRVGLYKPWVASMDEGWTRFLLERYGFAPVTLDNAAIRAGKLGTKFDVVVLADSSKSVIATGKPKRAEGEMSYFPEPRPEHAGGLGKEGAAALREFVEGGGTLVALASASEYAIEELQLPVRNALARVKPDEFLCPGTLVRIEVDPSHPVTFGLPASTPAFLNGPLAFQTTLPGAEMTRQVLATYPAEARDVLVSGWIRGEEKLTRNAAAVALTVGDAAPMWTPDPRPTATATATTTPEGSQTPRASVTVPASTTPVPDWTPPPDEWPAAVFLPLAARG